MSKVAAEVGSTANNYQILAKLASGGMAEIFLARGASVAGVERYCVLKRILRDRATDAQFVRMFVDEARLAAQLQHPNIASVYDIGKLGDSYFFTMEYVHGETVRSVLQKSGALKRPVPLACALTIAAGAAAGLHHAHARNGIDGRPLGIVHRDVSPSNLMVSYEGHVKLVDFGVAKAADRASETRSGTVKGKISYLSPEQCRGKALDRRSDLFSLGIVLWEMLTAERLYRRANDFENMTAIVSEEPPPPSTRRKDIAPEIDALVLKLLAKSPDDRFASADELVEAIEAASVRAGAMVSPSAVGRFVRELFGQRPEPWLETETRTVPQGPITVTSQPLPKELAASPEDRLEADLQGVPDLSSPSIVSADDDDDVPGETNVAFHRTQPGTPARRPTVPLDSARIARPRAISETDAAPRHELATEKMLSEPAPLAPPPTAPVLRPSGPIVAPLVVSGSGPTGSAPSGPRVLPLAAPPPSSPVPPSGPRPLPLAANPSVSMSAPSIEIVSGSHSIAMAPLPARRASWPLFAVIGVALAAGSLLVWWLMRETARAPAAVASTTVPVAPPPPAEHARAPIVEHIDVDAAPAIPAEVVAPDAAPPPHVPTAAGAPKTRPHPPVIVPPIATAPDAIALAFDAKDFAHVVALCAADGPSDAHAAACTIAACRQHADVRAREWVAKVGGQRATVLARCLEVHVDPTLDCTKNPLDCQH